MSKFRKKKADDIDIDQAPQLKKTIGLFHSTSILIAMTGHIAIFISPSVVLAYSGSVGVALVIWLAAGFINLFMALCYAEIGIMMPNAGGAYAYIMYCFGDLAGFVFVWGYAILICSPFWSVLAYTSIIYVIKPFYPHCQPPDDAVNILACLLLFLTSIANCLYMKYVTKVQMFLTSAKMVAMLVIIIAGLAKVAQGKTEHLENAFSGEISAGGIAMGIGMGFFAYGGWQCLLSLMEEVKDPAKDVPRSLYGSFAIIITCFVLCNVAYVTVLSPAEVLHSSAVAVSFSGRISGVLTPIITILVAISSVGCLNGAIMGHSRVIFAAARKGHLPVLLGMISRRYCTPIPAIILLTTLSMVLLLSGTMLILIQLISLYSVLMSLTCVLCLLYLRWNEPHIDRPLKLSMWIPVSQLLLSLAVVVLFIYQKPAQSALAFFIIACGIPVYWAGVIWKKKPRSLQGLMLESIDTCEPDFSYYCSADPLYLPEANTNWTSTACGIPVYSITVLCQNKPRRLEKADRYVYKSRDKGLGCGDHRNEQQ